MSLHCDFYRYRIATSYDKGLLTMGILISGLRNSLLVAILFAPVISLAQATSLNALLSGDGQQFCGISWDLGVQSDQRLYQDCLREQSQAKLRIQALNGRYGAQRFFRETAFPFCRSNQDSNSGLNLVELSFCLDDEIVGYQAIQDLRRRYGSNRVDSEASQAIAIAGSWAAAANQLKRSTSLKTVRQGT